MANLRTMTTTAQKSTENANSPFCNHFSIIASRLNNYPGISGFLVSKETVVLRR